MLDVTERPRRLYDRMRAKLVRHEVGARSGLRDYLLFPIDLTVLVVRVMRDPRVSFLSRLRAALAFVYVISPIDLIPEIFLGPLGLTDDALLLVFETLRLLRKVHPDLLRHHWSGQGDLLTRLIRPS